MEENLTLEQEEIVHENPVLNIPIKSPIVLGLLNAVAAITLFGLPVLAHFFGNVPG